MRSITIILLALAFPYAALSQVVFDDVAYDKIPYKKVRQYLANQQKAASVDCFADLKATCQNEQDFSTYRMYTRHYRIEGELDEVWDTYIDASPTESWRTRKSAVALLYDRKLDEIFYDQDECNGSEIGQILYLNLRLVKGLYHLATSMEITEIQKEESLIEISYVDNGINQGKQWISMKESDDGFTEIVHTSVIKSDSRFRDRILYPYFHNKLIKAFHRNMRKEVAEKQLALR